MAVDRFRHPGRLLGLGRVQLHHRVDFHRRAPKLLDALGLLPGGFGHLFHQISHVPDFLGHAAKSTPNGFRPLGHGFQPLHIFGDQGGSAPGGLSRPPRQLADLLGHHRKTGAGLSGPGRLHRGVQGQQIGLKGDFIDGFYDLGCPPAHVQGVLGNGVQLPDGFIRAAHHRVNLPFERISGAGVFRVSTGDGGNFLQGRRGLLNGDGLTGRAVGDVFVGLRHFGGGPVDLLGALVQLAHRPPDGTGDPGGEKPDGDRRKQKENRHRPPIEIQDVGKHGSEFVRLLGRRHAPALAFDRGEGGHPRNVSKPVGRHAAFRRQHPIGEFLQAGLLPNVEAKLKIGFGMGDHPAVFIGHEGISGFPNPGIGHKGRDFGKAEMKADEAGEFPPFVGNRRKDGKHRFFGQLRVDGISDERGADVPQLPEGIRLRHFQADGTRPDVGVVAPKIGGVADFFPGERRFPVFGGPRENRSPFISQKYEIIRAAKPLQRIQQPLVEPGQFQFAHGSVGIKANVHAAEALIIGGQAAGDSNLFVEQQLHGSGETCRRLGRLVCGVGFQGPGNPEGGKQRDREHGHGHQQHPAGNQFEF